MNRQRWNHIIYWVATLLMVFGQFGSGAAALLQLQGMVDLIIPLGYPQYFLYIIGMWKILGVIVILIPGYKLVKEWAYAGLFFAMTGAVFSHLASGQIVEASAPLMQTIFIVVSWYFRKPEMKLSPSNNF